VVYNLLIVWEVCLQLILYLTMLSNIGTVLVTLCHRFPRAFCCYSHEFQFRGCNSDVIFRFRVLLIFIVVYLGF
jgi:hypothetical protein